MVRMLWGPLLPPGSLPLMLGLSQCLASATSLPSIARSLLPSSCRTSLNTLLHSDLFNPELPQTQLPPCPTIPLCKLLLTFLASDLAGGRRAASTHPAAPAPHIFSPPTPICFTLLTLKYSYPRKSYNSDAILNSSIRCPSLQPAWLQPVLSTSWVQGEQDTVLGVKHQGANRDVTREGSAGIRSC